MSDATTIVVASASRRRRRSSNYSSYSRLEAAKKAETRANYVTAGILGLIAVALLASLGIIAFGLAG